jgi:hypothetical protein
MDKAKARDAAEPALPQGGGTTACLYHTPTVTE